MENQEQQMQPATAQELQDLMDYLQSCYKGNDDKVTAALCVGLMIHMRTLLFADNNLGAVEGVVHYLNSSFQHLLIEWQQFKQGRTLLH
jgi:hypothetical protein